MTKMSLDEATVSQIGQMFVKQYYLQLNSDPGSVHRFYQDDSSFAHGGHDLGSTEIIRGQKAIHDKIMSLDFSEVHARIKQVDSQATLKDGIVVQVTGEISTHGNPMRNFVQTFVLCPKQMKQYYVLNDIFRYQEPVELDYTSESENNEAQSERSDTNIPQFVNEDNTPTFPTPPSPVDPGHNPPEQPDEEIKEEKTREDSWEGFNGGSESEHPSVSINDPDTFDHYSPPPEEIQGLSPHQSKEQPPSMVPKSQPTWAGLVSKTNPPPSLLSQPTQRQPAMPQREVKSQRKPLESPRSAPAPLPNPPKDRLGKKGPVQLQTPDTQQVFIGGLPSDVTEDDVRTTFGDLGNIIEVRLNPKNFGFIVFDSPEPVRKILDRKNSRPFYIRNKTINIEPKKSTSQKGSGFLGKREMGGPRGGGGGMGTRKPFKN